MSARTYPDPVIRYVPTYMAKDGLRTLATPCQGRHTFATEQEAQRWIDLVTANNSARTIAATWGTDPRFEVRPCKCWPIHFDPVGIYFD